MLRQRQAAQHVRPVPASGADVEDGLAGLLGRLVRLRELRDQVQRRVARADAAEVVVEDREHVVRDFGARRGFDGAAPFEVLARPGPDVVVWVYMR